MEVRVNRKARKPEWVRHLIANQQGGGEALTKIVEGCAQIRERMAHRSVLDPRKPSFVQRELAIVLADSRSDWRRNMKRSACMKSIIAAPGGVGPKSRSSQPHCTLFTIMFSGPHTLKALSKIWRHAPSCRTLVVSPLDFEISRQMLFNLCKEHRFLLWTLSQLRETALGSDDSFETNWRLAREMSGIPLLRLGEVVPEHNASALIYFVFLFKQTDVPILMNRRVLGTFTCKWGISHNHCRSFQ